SREFPVLFHLMDVSRPRTSRQATAIDSANLLSAVEQLRRPAAEESEPSPQPIAAPEPVVTNNDAPPAIDTPPIDTPTIDTLSNVAQAIVVEAETAAVTENASV